MAHSPLLSCPLFRLAVPSNMKGASFLFLLSSLGLSLGFQIDRRGAISAAIGSASVAWLPQNPANADGGSATDEPAPYERRDRNKNKNALVREDYWYMTNRIPPRVLDLDQLPADDPTWNAWGTCTKSEATGNSCTYVSLKQKQPAYSRYAFSIDLGAREYEELGKVLNDAVSSGAESEYWEKAAIYVYPGSGKERLPSPAVDALLKMTLFATAMLTSPNYNGPSRELLVSRFYVNEAAFATKELEEAIKNRDGTRALSAYQFGKDSWNSYFAILNRSIVPKVGEKFVLIA